jgi:hypothetical protein
MKQSQIISGLFSHKASQYTIRANCRKRTKKLKENRVDAGNLQLLCPKFIFYAWHMLMDEEAK